MAFDPEAQWQENQANLGVQATWEEGGITQGLNQTKARVGYQESEVDRAEPGTFRASANRANKGGLLTSGINARRRTDVVNNFAARRTANQLTLSQAQESAKRAQEGVGLKRTQGEGKNARERDAAKEAYARANPTIAPPPIQSPKVNVATPPKPPGEWFFSPYSHQWVGKARLNAERLKGK